ncbi:HAD family hydrolase [Thiomicrorhabdus heinhorstiae]|uniref:sucrose-phosphate synthase n=1 Tax=Thiomicrorhabdus heinhorstiae TaxID=2748010 RepID=A0ABS0C485_9GAMM|nr:glycosyltransferase [Thiomicrorhabdus heinhorstiae]
MSSQAKENNTSADEDGIYIALISVHGLIRGRDLELGRDADTGGQTLYVVELAQALSVRPDVKKVELFTRLVRDDSVSSDYAEHYEQLNDKLQIVRIEAGADEYLPKEQLWDHLDAFADNMAAYFRRQNCFPDILHSHYADAGYVGSLLTHWLSIPLIHTGHSLGRVKRARLIASGLHNDEIESLYNMSRRIDAEEHTLASSERVITSTYQEIEEQYEVYDYYQPEQMRVLPPGVNLDNFTPPLGNELNSNLFARLIAHLKEPDKPIILALSRPDTRKNIASLIEAFGLSQSLQDKANLVIVAGNRDDVEDLESGARQVFHELWAMIDRYDLYGKVALPKHHSRDEVPMIYRIAAASGGVFVNPALTEPFGLTLIEAAASGVPIVATEDGGPRDIIANCRNGLLIDPLEPRTITDALQSLLDSPQTRRDMVRQGLTGVKEHYSWQAHAERYLQEIYPIIKQAERLPRRPVSRRSELYKDRAFVSSLDQNLMGSPEALQEMLRLLKENRKTTLFIIATGRRLDSALRLLKHHAIPEPDVLISGSGTEIHYAPDLTKDTAWEKHIDFHWTPHQVRSLLDDVPGLARQAKSEQSHFKISYLVDTRQLNPEDLVGQLHQEEQTVTVQFSFGQYLDILPIRASKGMALRYVVDRWQIPLERVLVAGGSGSDEDMMRGNSLAVVVANRHDEELSQLTDLDRIYFAKNSYEKGILEAFEYYDFFGQCRSPQEEE